MNMTDQPKRPRAHPAVSGIGFARMKFTAEGLGMLRHIPSTYKLLGSENSGNGVVSLIFGSNEVAGGKIVDMCVEISDAGSTRTVNVRPCP